MTNENGSVTYRKLSTILITIVLAISGWAFALYKDSVKAEVLDTIGQKYVSREVYEERTEAFELRLKRIEDKLDLLLQQRIK